jgi:hypothetical protein
MVAIRDQRLQPECLSAETAETALRLHCGYPGVN